MWPRLPPDVAHTSGGPEPAYRAQEPARDIQCQTRRLREEVKALQSCIHDLMSRLAPVMAPDEAKGDGCEQSSQARTPLGQEIQECAGVAYATRLAVIKALDRIQLP